MTDAWIAPQVERTDPGRVLGERQALEAWLDFHRDTLLLKCAGLTAGQLKERAVIPQTAARRPAREGVGTAGPPLARSKARLRLARRLQPTRPVITRWERKWERTLLHIAPNCSGPLTPGLPGLDK
jgi:hypothetical protein